MTRRTTHILLASGAGLLASACAMAQITIDTDTPTLLHGSWNLAAFTTATLPPTAHFGYLPGGALMASHEPVAGGVSFGPTDSPPFPVTDPAFISPFGTTLQNAVYGGDYILGDGTPVSFVYELMNYDGSFGEFSGVFTFVAEPVPEPHEYALMAGLGLLGFAAWRRRRA